MADNVYLLRKALAKKTLASFETIKCSPINNPPPEVNVTDLYLGDELNEAIAKLPAQLRMSVGEFYSLAEYTRSNTYLNLSIQYQPYYRRVKQLKKEGLSFTEFSSVIRPAEDKEVRIL